MSDADRLFIGGDCGGTGTRVAVVDPTGRVVGTGCSGPGNPRDVGIEGLRSAVEAALRQAMSGEEVRSRAVLRAVFGVAGVATDEEQASAASALSEMGEIGPGLRVVPDLRTAHAGALAGRPGMVLICGTGSCCYGRLDDGREWRAGGWGPRLDDPGSASDLGLRAIRAAIRAADGRGEPTRLTETVLEGLGLTSLRDVVAIVEDGRQRRRIAALAPDVIAAAQAGDSAASTIVAGAARALADLVVAVATSLPVGSGPSTLAVTGGVLRSGGPLRELLAAELDRRLPGLAQREPALPPVLGAVLMAIDPSGGDQDAVLRELQAAQGTGSRRRDPEA